MKHCCLAILLAFVLFANGKSQQLKDVLVPSEYGQTVFVSVNDIYLLYLKPVTPFINDEGIIMVPLQALVQSFLGLRVDIYEEDGIMTAHVFTKGFNVEDVRVLNFINNKLEATIYDSSELSYTNYPILLSAKPIYIKESNEMLVPLDVLLNAFNIEYFWEPTLNIMSLKSNTIKPEPFLDNPRYVVWGLTRAFIPEKVTFESTSNNEWLLKLTIQGFQSLEETDGPTPVWFTQNTDNPPQPLNNLILFGSGATKCPKQDNRFVCEISYTREILDTTPFIAVRFAP